MINNSLLCVSIFFVRQAIFDNNCSFIRKFRTETDALESTPHSEH